MNQDIDQLQHSHNAVGYSTVASKAPRPLTHDEKKAAEAAFQHLPYNPEWSNSALRVYMGIVNAIARMHPDPSEVVWDRAA